MSIETNTSRETLVFSPYRKNLSAVHIGKTRVFEKSFPPPPFRSKLRKYENVRVPLSTRRLSTARKVSMYFVYQHTYLSKSERTKVSNLQRIRHNTGSKLPYVVLRTLMTLQ